MKVRVNHQFFRKAIMAAYNNTCCITGLQQASLLVAGHIKPWAADEANRMNPRNGLALNALHDRAFELGLFTIRPADYVIEVSAGVLTPKEASINKGLDLGYLIAENQAFSHLFLRPLFVDSS